jgi:hypothetical protein
MTQDTIEQLEAQEELPQGASSPPEMIDPREGRVAKALRAAVRKSRDSAAGEA